LSFDSLDDLEKSLGNRSPYLKAECLKLRKWVANSDSKSVLLTIPQKDLGSNVREIDLTSQLMPDSKALGLVWDVEGDKLRMCSKRMFNSICTRREMLSVLMSQFDPLGILAPCLLGGKLILQKVTTMGLDWDASLPDDVLSDWKAWVACMESFLMFPIPHCYFAMRPVVFQLHGFCDASNSAFACVIFLRRVCEDGSSCVAFVQGKSKVV